jgi:hypothetical protein
MNKNLNHTKQIEQDTIGQYPILGSENIFETPTDVGLLERFLLTNGKLVNYGKYIDLQIVFTISLALALGLSQKKLIREIAIYTTRLLKKQLSRENCRKLLAQTKQYIHHYRSITDFRNYHAELVLQLGNNLLILKYKYIISVFISIVIGYFIGLFILKNRYRFQLLTFVSNQFKSTTRKHFILFRAYPDLLYL